MKITVDKKVDIDIEPPLFFKRKYGSLIGIINETEAILTDERFISLYNNRDSIKVLLSEYEPSNEISKEEFEQIFNTAKQNINDFKL